MGLSRLDEASELKPYQKNVRGSAQDKSVAAQESLDSYYDTTQDFIM